MEKINIEEYLSHFEKFTKDPTLNVMYYLMEKFDNPHEKLKFIHVAGTNGKGSICEMLNNILIKQGYKVGKFISPHLITFNETITVNNLPILDDEVSDILIKMDKHIKEYNSCHEIKVKWFEVITSLAIIYFAQKKCDIVTIETGLGGLTDCTNVVNSFISVIANIGFDHVDVLGHTLEEITMHKAGIIKENSHCVTYYQDNVTPLIEQNCIDKNTSLCVVNSESLCNYSSSKDYQKFDYKDFKDVYINLKGKVQIYNAAIAIECINILNENGFRIDRDSIYDGLNSVVHKARFETLHKEPTIIFDGGHNENAIKNLKETINQYYKDKKIIYIVSLLKTKDYPTIIKHFVNTKNAVFFFTDGNDKNRYVAKEDLLKAAKENYNEENNIEFFTSSLEDAIKTASENYKDELILVVGSFYVYKDVCPLISKLFK